MAEKGVGRVVKMGRANTRYVVIPADIAKDSKFPFKDGEQVRIAIDGNRLIIEKLDE